MRKCCVVPIKLTLLQHPRCGHHCPQVCGSFLPLAEAPSPFSSKEPDWSCHVLTEKRFKAELLMMYLAEFRLQIVVIQLPFEVTSNSLWMSSMRLFDSFECHGVRNVGDYVVNRVRNSEPRSGRADSVSEYVEDIGRLGYLYLCEARSWAYIMSGLSVCSNPAG